MLYKHYKGNLYRIIAQGIMERNKEAMVVYQGTHGGQIWIRPASEFFGVVAHQGGLKRRFEELNEPQKDAAPQPESGVQNV